MTQKYRKAWKTQWKHIRNKLGIHTKNGFYMSSDIQRYIDYCKANGYCIRFIDLNIMADTPYAFALR